MQSLNHHNNIASIFKILLLIFFVSFSFFFLSLSLLFSAQRKNVRHTPYILYLFDSQRTLDYVKIDVEGAEFPALKHIISSGLHSRIRQLAVEVHTPHRRIHMESMSVKDYSEIFQLFEDLERLGFTKFAYTSTNWCCMGFADLTPGVVLQKTRTLCCYEVFYINNNLVREQ